MNEPSSSKIDLILNETIAFERNFILPRKIAAAGTGISNDPGVGDKGKGGTEINYGLITPDTTPDIEDGRIGAEKAR